jgi:hypothetical protein
MMENIKNNILIPPEIEEEFNGVVDVTLENEPLLAAKPLKYKVTSRVWVPGLGKGEEVQIIKGFADTYLVRQKSGEYHICHEDDIQIVN